MISLFRSLLFLAVLTSCHQRATDFGGMATGPVEGIPLSQKLTFSIRPDPKSKDLLGVVERTDGQTGLQSLTTGESARPGEKFAYYWDADTEILWFATKRMVKKIQLKDLLATPSSTKSYTRPIPTADEFDDIPAVMRTYILEISK